jgi:Lon protease-like protein
MAEMLEIPLFPLRSVLFPRGKLSLQIFEKRYIDLVAGSLRDGSGFGVILLKEGEEVIKPGKSQQLHSVGTYARIIDWDQLENGLLGITVEGESKFHLQNHWSTDSGLIMGRVIFSEVDTPDKSRIPVGEEMSGMTELLQLLEKHPAVQEMELQIDYDNLWDLGWRLSELIPVATEIRQELLELDDPWERIQLLEKSIHFLMGD